MGDCFEFADRVGGGFVNSFFFYRNFYGPSLNASPLICFPYQSTQESIHASVKGGMKYNTGRLLMVLHKPLIPHKGDEYDDMRGAPRYAEEPEMEGAAMLPMP